MVRFGARGKGLGFVRFGLGLAKWASKVGLMKGKGKAPCPVALEEGPGVIEEGSGLRVVDRRGLRRSRCRLSSHRMKSWRRLRLHQNMVTVFGTSMTALLLPSYQNLHRKMRRSSPMLPRCQRKGSVVPVSTQMLIPFRHRCSYHSVISASSHGGNCGTKC